MSFRLDISTASVAELRRIVASYARPATLYPSSDAARVYSEACAWLARAEGK